MEVQEIDTTIGEKHQINSDNPKAPYGQFVCDYNGETIKLATWKDTIYDKYKEGDKVHVKVGNYTENEYGKSGSIVFIEYGDGTSQETLEQESPGEIPTPTNEVVSIGDGSVIVIEGRKFRLEEI